MALPLRVTPQTALSTAQRLVADLTRCVDESGRLPSVRQVGDDLATAAAYGSDRRLDVDLVAAGVSAEQIERVAIWLGLDSSPGTDPAERRRGAAGAFGYLSIASFTPATVPVSRAAAVRAPILVCAIGDGVELPTADRARLEALFEERGLVVLIGPPSPSRDQLHAAARDRAWSVWVETWEGIATASMAQRIQAAPWANTTDLLRAQSLVPGLDSATRVIGTVIEQEIRGLRVKRSMTQQKATRLQSTGAAGGSSELSAFRDRLTRQFSDFERGVAERLSSLVTPQVGSLWKDLENRVELVGPLEEEAKSRTLVLKLPAAQEGAILDHVRETLQAHMTADLVAMRDLFQVTAAEAEQTLPTAAGLNFGYLGPDRIKRLLDVSVRLDKSHRGEMQKKGPMWDPLESTCRHASLSIL